MEFIYDNVCLPLGINILRAALKRNKSADLGAACILLKQSSEFKGLMLALRIHRKWLYNQRTSCKCIIFLMYLLQRIINKNRFFILKT